MSVTESKFTRFTAENCEKEPIHIPGSVQEHGILIALRTSDLTILQISANCYDLLGLHHEELLHQPLSQLMDVSPVEEASAKLGEKLPRLLNPIPIALNARGRQIKFDGILHRSGRTLILELERHLPKDLGYGGFGGFYEAIREVATKLMTVHSLNDVMKTACEEVRKLTGFSRVLAYQFDEDWNGTVIAESKDAEVKSLLHHRFPSTDIPKQARDLYTTNWLRIIPDVNYKPSPIVPAANPITDRPLDLSNSVLRSVSPIHIEYMKNMGQAASMSISLLQDRKLWGLISCHHPEPKFLKYDTRVASEFIGQMVSAQISARNEAFEVNHSAQLKDLFACAVTANGNLNEALRLFRKDGSALLGLVDSPGAVIFAGDERIKIGATPDDASIERIREILSGRSERLFFTSSAGTDIGLAEDLQKRASGLMKASFSNGSSIIWFRPELTDAIQWGGNPELSKLKGTDGTLNPRKSFETWIESVDGRSRSWKQTEVDSAASLIEVLSKMATDRSSAGEGQRTPFHEALKVSLKSSASTKEQRAANASSTQNDTTILEAASNSKALLEGFEEFSVLFLDENGAIQSWTAGAKRLLGYSASQALGHKIDMFLSDDEVAKDKHHRILDFVREHKRCEEEIWLYRSDRTSFWGKLLVSAVRNASEQLIGYSVVIQDITKEKAAEEELRATKVAAEAANHAKTAFLANISHEIRTPLGAVLGFAELLRDRKLSEHERENLSDRIHRNGEQLTSLINDLLDLTKVEANRLDVELLQMDLQALLTDVRDTLSLKASEKSIRFTVDVVGSVPRFIVSDPTRLRQILVNIINNAIKFTPQGGTVKVDVSLDTVTSKKRVIFRVTDTGRGMSEEQMSKLFQPFAQGDISTTRKFGGTGLGLFVSQRLARLLNGDVSIQDSRVGAGSTFMISIDPGEPDSQRTFTEISSADRPVMTNQLHNAELENCKILVVDDSADNRHLIKQYLTKAGATVETAENGREGVKAALEDRYDVVLMDIQMPVLDGNEAMRSLQGRGYRVPVVALTAHAMNEERIRALANGFADYLTKPIARDLLVRTIRDLIDNK